MKKILFLFIFLGVQSFVQAQFNVGGNAILQFPQGHFKNISTLSYGGSVSFGYSFAQRLELSLVYTGYGYKGGLSQGFSLNSKTVEAKFFFLNGNTRPYIGCGVGRFTETFDNIGMFPKQIENKWGLEPKAGVLMDSKMLRNLFVDASLSWFRDDFSERDLNAFNLAVGLKYMLDFKKN